MRNHLLALAFATMSLGGAPSPAFATDPANCSTTAGVKSCSAKSEYVAIQACGTRETNCTMTDNGNRWTCTCVASSTISRPGSLTERTNPRR